MYFYQRDTLHALIARLAEVGASDSRYAAEIEKLCKSGEHVFLQPSQAAYNRFMDECEITLNKLHITI
ncbi:hypothetical protein KXR87_01020 [Yokenella regensburgei]|uniref:hypothetical protein n=1 Tax=Yokenella regensburgei TaxID=158877 RepID=UPI003F16BEBC